MSRPELPNALAATRWGGAVHQGSGSRARPWSRLPGLLAALSLLCTPAVSQVQQNGAAASLLVDGRALDGYSRSHAFEWIPGRPISIELSGEPGRAVALFTGDRLDPGIAYGAIGLLNLRQPTMLFSGFDPSGILFRTGPSGRLALQLAGVAPTGTLFALQGVVDGASGLGLTAPQQIRMAPARLVIEKLTRFHGTNVFAVPEVEMTPDQFGSFGEYAFSPDGERFAYLFRESSSGLWMLFLMDAVGTNANRRIMALQAPQNSTLFDLRWSPSGSHVAVRQSNSVNPGSPAFLLLVDREGLSSSMLPLFSIEEYAWSPDGTRLAFRADLFGNSVLYVGNDQGASAIPVSSFATGAKPGPGWAWSPDSSLIAFPDSVSIPNLYVVRPDGTGGTLLATGARQFAWSPDSSLIAYRFEASFFPAEENLFVVRPDGTGKVRLNATVGPFIPGVVDLRWSPDSQHVAYLSNEAGEADQLFVARRDGDPSARHSVSQLVAQGSRVRSYSWSAGGSELAFAFWTRSVLYVAETDGSLPKALTTGLDNGSRYQWNPDPGSKTIAFVSQETPGGSVGVNAVRTDGAYPRVLSGSYSLSSNDAFSWDPSGRWMAFESGLVRVTPFAGGEPLAVEADRFSRGFRWSPAVPPAIPDPPPLLVRVAPPLVEAP